MHHGRRNEVYRDLGSDLHEPGDPEFVDVTEMVFEPESALLLCSDGLTDLVESSTIDQVARQFAGRPERVVDGLIDAANRAGGKDNVTVVCVEGAQYRESVTSGRPAATLMKADTSNSEQYVRAALLVLLTMLLVVSVGRLPRSPIPAEHAVVSSPAGSAHLVVRPGESISEALKRATPGAEVVVEPGEYREAVSLPSHVRLVSRVAAGAVLRLPATASETDAAAVATGVSGAALVGFRIVGDATSALGTGVLVQNSEVSIIDTEISGATNVAIDVAGRVARQRDGKQRSRQPGRRPRGARRLVGAHYPQRVHEKRRLAVHPRADHPG